MYNRCAIEGGSSTRRRWRLAVGGRSRTLARRHFTRCSTCVQPFSEAPTTLNLTLTSAVTFSRRHLPLLRNVEQHHSTASPVKRQLNKYCGRRDKPPPAAISTRWRQTNKRTNGLTEEHRHRVKTPLSLCDRHLTL